MKAPIKKQRTYEEFLETKSQYGCDSGFEPTFMPDKLFDFQKALVEWAVRKGRAAVLADCGLGKSAMQLTWAQNVVEKTNGRVLILTPLAVSHQTVKEAEKFGIEAGRSCDGKLNGEKIVVTNYERLHYFNPADFQGVVCDESSVLKNHSGTTCQKITDFMADIKYRSLFSATPAPNDHTELGTSAEALGLMRRVEMLAMYFVHDGGETSKWRLKGHAENPFWRFVASWARTIRKPSDIGFNDADFILPELSIHQHILASVPIDGFLFPMNAITLDEQRKERRSSLTDRVEKVAEIANKSSGQFIAWCSLNDESVAMSKLIRGAKEITGSMDDGEKSEAMIDFAAGKIRAIVTKPEIAGFGMNFQNCSAMSFFPSHSYEQYYQAVRRCWRFGQKNPVQVHIVTTESESEVLANMQKKERNAAIMFDGIVRHMKEFYKVEKKSYKPKTQMEIPIWLKH